MTTVDELRRTGYEISQAIAPTWESRRAKIEEVAGPVSAWMVRELGATAWRDGARARGGRGRHRIRGGSPRRLQRPAICTDFSPAKLDAARRRGGELGLRNVDYAVIDGERIDLESASVDGVLCRYGYMLMASRRGARGDPPRAAPGRAFGARGLGPG